MTHFFRIDRRRFLHTFCSVLELGIGIGIRNRSTLLQSDATQTAQVLQLPKDFPVPKFSLGDEVYSDWKQEDKLNTNFGEVYRSWGRVWGLVLDHPECIKNTGWTYYVRWEKEEREFFCYGEPPQVSIADEDELEAA